MSGDYNISDRDQLRVRYVYNQNPFIDTAASLPTFFQVQKFSYHLGNIAEFHTFSANLSNEFRVGFHGTVQGSGFRSRGSESPIKAKELSESSGDVVGSAFVLGGGE